MSTKLNDTIVRNLPAPDKGAKVYFFARARIESGEAPKGFGVRVTAAGARAFILDYRMDGRQHRYTIGLHPRWNVLRAVAEARELHQRLARGENPMMARRGSCAPAAASAPTVAAVLDQWMLRHGGKTRTAKLTGSAFERLVKPAIGKIAIYDVKRRHIADLLDAITEDAGPAQAHRTFAMTRSAFTWWASRDDEFTSPIIRGMAPARGASRDRVLSDEEIRAIWPALDGKFGAIVKLLLLTGQRRTEVGGMEWAEIDGDTWTIPAERYKTGRAQSVPLTAPVLAIIAAQPRTGRYVFPSGHDGARAFTNWSETKKQLDRAAPTAPWRLHDLRRTARTLMSRAGVRPDVAERVVGHAIQGVAAVYDRHTYEPEKRAALEALAGLLDRILDPVENVVALRG